MPVFTKLKLRVISNYTIKKSSKSIRNIKDKQQMIWWKRKTKGLAWCFIQ